MLIDQSEIVLKEKSFMRNILRWDNGDNIFRKLEVLGQNKVLNFYNKKVKKKGLGFFFQKFNYFFIIFFLLSYYFFYNCRVYTDLNLYFTNGYALLYVYILQV